MNNLINAEFYPIYGTKLIEDYRYESLSVTKKGRNLLDIFKENLIHSKGSYCELYDISTIKPFIRSKYPDADTICSSVPELKVYKNLNHIHSPLDLLQIDVAIIEAEFGIAETGMVWVSEKTTPIHSLDFIAKHLFILLDPNRIVRDMGEAYDDIYHMENNYGCFLSGPAAMACSEDEEKKYCFSHKRTFTVCFQY